MNSRTDIVAVVAMLTATRGVWVWYGKRKLLK